MSLNNGMVAYATTSYNTGYMHGDIKGAFLSDTDTTNVLRMIYKVVKEPLMMLLTGLLVLLGLSGGVATSSTGGNVL